MDAVIVLLLVAIAVVGFMAIGSLALLIVTLWRRQRALAHRQTHPRTGPGLACSSG